MNENRREELKIIVDALVKLFYELDGLQDDENEAYDNLPESLQQTWKAEAMVKAAESLSNACEELEQVLSYLEDATNC